MHLWYCLAVKLKTFILLLMHFLIFILYSDSACHGSAMDHDRVACAALARDQ